jgi:hypothetical protein
VALPASTSPGSVPDEWLLEIHEKCVTNGFQAKIQGYTLPQRAANQGRLRYSELRRFGLFSLQGRKIHD